MFSHWRREFREMQTYGQKLLALAEKYEFAMYRWVGDLHVTAASTVLGEANGSIPLLHQSIEALKAHGVLMITSYYLSMLAEACGHLGRFAEGIAALDEALALAAELGEHFWTAETYRLRGDMLAAQGALQEAEIAYQQAIDVARGQQARSLELRATMSLCRLWQAQGKCRAAIDLLSPVYEWFTEGFDTPDLKEAHALLAALTA
jgi:predicted ATPase